MIHFCVKLSYALVMYYVDLQNAALFLLLCYFDKKVQGRDRLVVQGVAEQLGLEGSYIPRTYIQQIQLEKLVNEVMV